MHVTLEQLYSTLRLNISTLCRHLRNKDYAVGSEPHQNALSNLLYFELMADELAILLGHRENLIKAIEQYLIGEEFDPTLKGDDSGSIYKYCLMYFEIVYCPIGSSTDELKDCVAMYTNLQQRLWEGYDEFFPNLDFLTEGQGEEQQTFDIKTDGADRDLVSINAIEVFNQRMAKANKLLKTESSIVDILTLLKENSNEQ